jgi:hypothetical protein
MTAATPACLAMRNWLAPALPLVFLALTSCHNIGPEAEPSLEELTFELSILDTEGQTVMTGTLTLNFSGTDDNDDKIFEITGVWSLSVAQCAGNSQGQLYGSVRASGAVYISIDDGCSDSGIGLDGRFESTPPSDFSGIVYAITIFGPTDTDWTFEATYRQGAQQGDRAALRRPFRLRPATVARVISEGSRLTAHCQPFLRMPTV